MQTIVKTFNGKSEAEINNGGTSVSASWEKLLRYISEAVMLRTDEVVDGLIASEEGITVKLSRKPGRKVQA